MNLYIFPPDISNLISHLFTIYLLSCYFESQLFENKIRQNILSDQGARVTFSLKENRLRT